MAARVGKMLALIAIGLAVVIAIWTFPPNFFDIYLA
jgi:hypothetical protein